MVAAEDVVVGPVRLLDHVLLVPNHAPVEDTVAPRRVIGTAGTLNDALVGQRLTNLLRWSQREGELHWACAA